MPVAATLPSVTAERPMRDMGTKVVYGPVLAFELLAARQALKELIINPPDELAVYAFRLRLVLLPPDRVEDVSQ